MAERKREHEREGGDDGRWMKQAVPESRKGVFRKKAERAGMSTREYAEKERDAPGALGKEARLARTFERLRPKKHRGHHRGPKTHRKTRRSSERAGRR